jgi:hypothetical protein
MLGFALMRTLLPSATVLLAALAVFGAGQDGYAQTAASGGDAKTFERIAAVLQHPRCLNCHQPYSPLQGEQARRHTPPVVRGDDDKGAPAMRCTSCHRETNNAASGVPGAPHWQLAPAVMDWSALDGAQLCQRVKDPRRNGNRSLQALVAHMEGDALVRWGWNPGGNRAPVPLPHREFVELLKNWVAAGAPCPV